MTFLKSPAPLWMGDNFCGVCGGGKRPPHASMCSGLRPCAHTPRPPPWASPGVFSCRQPARRGWGAGGNVGAAIRGSHLYCYACYTCRAQPEHDADEAAGVLRDEIAGRGGAYGLWAIAPSGGAHAACGKAAPSTRENKLTHAGLIDDNTPSLLAYAPGTGAMRVAFVAVTILFSLFFWSHYCPVF